MLARKGRTGFYTALGWMVVGRHTARAGSTGTVTQARWFGVHISERLDAILTARDGFGR